ncbi:MAG: hypothetical protein AMS23_07975 [Bacteroides sp. SM1_62]|nr:MAG: hypothetical protein AMS23_07975 [Bacteroides sp. SM1_62]
MVIPLKANEVVIKAGDSSYLTDAAKICGKLILTNQRIYFKSTNGHAEKYDQEILPADIREVIFFNIRRFLPNGLNVILKSGEERKFSLKKRNEMGEMINKMY